MRTPHARLDAARPQHESRTTIVCLPMNGSVIVVLQPPLQDSESLGTVGVATAAHANTSRPHAATNVRMMRAVTQICGVMRDGTRGGGKCKDIGGVDTDVAKRQMARRVQI